MNGDLEIEVAEEVITEETVGKWKPWFNGTHFFYTIKTLPPHS